MSPTDIWAIYSNPSDYPGKFVARRWVIGVGPTPQVTEETIIAETLDDVRGAVLAIWPDLVRMTRHPDDDPCIVETWI